MLRIAGAITLGCSFLRSFAAAHSCMDLSPKKSFLAGSRLDQGLAGGQGKGVLEISVQQADRAHRNCIRAS